MTKKRPKIIDRPINIQEATRQSWSPTIIRTRFVLQNERDLFNNWYKIFPASPAHALDKIVSGPHRDFLSKWVKSRFTCLGNNWHVGPILIKDRITNYDTWWFQNTSICMPDATYNPNVIPYKLIIIPLQINYAENAEEMLQIYNNGCSKC